MEIKIILFARSLELGKGKSRLAGFLDEKQRYELIKRLLEGTVKEIKKTGLAYSIHYEGSKESIKHLGNDLVAQGGQCLGERMLKALKEELKTNKAVVLVGSDLVNLSAAYIQEAFKALEEKDMVIGPSEDGGYGLIGMTRPLDVFSNMAYSRDDVCEKTLDKAMDLGASFRILKKIRDIDTIEDLVKEELGTRDVQLLGHGEYNLNYRFGKDKVFRINIGSQLGLGDEQILYEYKALKNLEPTGVTPKVYQAKQKGDWLPLGYLTMEYLEGRPLDYDRDMETAAYLLSKVHNHKAEQADLIMADRPFRVMYDEFISMFKKYRTWEAKDPTVEEWIDRLLAIARSRGLDEDIKRPCLINTELNNQNFIIGPSKEESYIIDWEKPLIGDCEQDLAHFTAPTTTNWKTDKLLSRKEIDDFLSLYESYREVDRELFYKYLMFNCLRGITWSAMAKVEYSQARALANDDTLEKINKFTSIEFIKFIYEEFYEVYDEK